jgi:Ni,Fe-hydrogenase I cytochrome b subunit
MKEHITILAALHIAYNILGLFVGIIIMVLVLGSGLISGDPDAIAILTPIAIIGSMFFFVISLPGLIGGIALFKRKPWGRILTLIVGCINLLNVPLGTALGIYTIWVLTNDEIVTVFSYDDNRENIPYE